MDSPDFATAVSAYRKALATARTNRKLADLDRDLLEHNGVSAARGRAGRDRRRQRGGRPRCGAAGAARPAGAAADASRDIAGRAAHRRTPAACIRSPIAGTVVEKLVTPGQLLQAGTTPCFTVADLSRVWVMAQLFGPDLAVGARRRSAPRS